MNPHIRNYIGTDVAKNLKAFSGYRSDIFGNEETEIGRKVRFHLHDLKLYKSVINYSFYKIDW